MFVSRYIPERKLVLSGNICTQINILTQNAPLLYSNRNTLKLKPPTVNFKDQLITFIIADLFSIIVSCVIFYTLAAIFFMNY